MPFINRRHAMGQLLSASSLLTAVPLAVDASTARAAESPRPAISVYGRLPDMSEVTLSPDGKRVGFIRNIKGQLVLMDYEITPGKLNFMPIADMKVRDLTWADNDRLLVTSSVTADLVRFIGDKNEYSRAHIVDVKARTSLLLYENLKDYYPIVIGSLGRISINGRPHVTASNVRFGAEVFYSLLAFDTTTGRYTKMDEGKEHVLNWVYKPDGTLIARSEYKQSEKLWRLRYLNTLWTTIYEEVFAELERPFLVGRGRAEDSLLVRFNGGKWDGKYIEFSRDGTPSEPTTLTGDNVSPLIHPASKRLVGFVRRNPEGNEYEFFDPLLEKLHNETNALLEGSTVTRVMSRADDPRKLIAYSEAVDDAGSYYFIDFTTGQNKLVGQTRADLPAEWIAPKSELTYKAADGLSIHGYLTLPPAPALKGRDPKNLPLVVLPHGGPQSADEIGFDWWSQALASRGYAVLQPNFRGSDGYGQEFVEKGYGEWGRKMQTDLSDGVRHLAKEGIIDARRVAITGASYGGYAAMAGVTLDPGIYRCAVAVAGVSNLKAMMDWEFKETGRRLSPTLQYWNRFMGDKSLWDAASPDLHVDKCDVPVLLIHGKDDDVVPIEQSQRMQRAMQKAGKPIEMLVLAGEDHWLTTEATRLQMLEATIAFIEKHNPPA